MNWVEDFYTKQEAWSGIYTSDVSDYNRYKALRLQSMAGAPPKSVLELGAGGGQNAYAVAELGYDVTAVELLEKPASHALVLASRVKNGSLKPFQGDFYSIQLDVDTKLELYRKMRAALKTGGKYIEGDCVVTPDKQREIWEWYYQHYSAEAISEALDVQDTLYHFDIPSTIEAQFRLLRAAGFSKVDLIWHDEGEEPAIFVAEV